MTDLETRPEMIDAPATEPGATDAFVERLFGAMLAAMDLQAVYLGDRLGYYRALADGGPLTSTELAARTGTARALRPRVAGAAGGHRLSSTVEDADARRRPSAATRCPPRPRRAADRPRSASPPAAAGPDRRRAASSSCDAHGWRRSAPAAACRGRTTAPTPARARPARTGRCSSTRSARSTCRRSRTSTPPAGAGGRVADIGCGLRLVVHRHRQGVPERHASTASTSTSRRSRRRGATPPRPGSPTGCSFHVPRRRRRSTAPVATTSCCAFECIHDMSDPVAVLAAMRRAGRRRRHRRWSWTSGWRRRSPPPATTSSGSCTASASCTACPTAWRTNPRSAPAR